MRARSLQFTEPGCVELTDVELAEPRPNDLLVRTRYSGISSGTELLAYRGEVPAELALDDTIGSLGGTFAYPFRYGYSCVGVVERSRGDPPPGTLVFVLHPHQDVFACSTDEAVVLSEVDARQATLFPLIETAFQISLDASDVKHEHVVVMGLGVIGLLTSLLLQRAGARVTAVEPKSWRRELAADLEIEAIAPDSAGLRDVPLVVEASGNPGALRSALALLAHEGCALVASWYGTKPVALDLGSRFHRRRLSIRSTQVSTIPAALAGRWTYARRRAAVLQLLRELPLKKLATHEFPFTRAADAFAALDAGDEPIVHAALVY